MTAMSRVSNRAPAARDTLEPGTHDVAGDRDGEVEEGLAALGLAADDADGLASPEPVDEPLLPARPVLQLDRGPRREAVHG